MNTPAQDFRLVVEVPYPPLWTSAAAIVAIVFISVAALFSCSAVYASTRQNKDDRPPVPVALAIALTSALITGGGVALGAFAVAHMWHHPNDTNVEQAIATAATRAWDGEISQDRTFGPVELPQKEPGFLSSTRSITDDRGHSVRRINASDCRIYVRDTDTDYTYWVYLQCGDDFAKPAHAG